MRIRKRSLFPLPPISHPLALLKSPSNTPSLQQQQQQQQQQLPQQKKEEVTTTSVTGELWKGKRVHLKGDHPKHVQPKEEEDYDDRSAPSDLRPTVLKKRNGCISSYSSLTPNPHQISEGKEAKGDDDEESLIAIHNHINNYNNSKRCCADTNARHALPFSSSSSSFHHHQVGRWFEGERHIPLKKRHGSYNEEAEDKDEKSIVVKEKKKAKTSKKKMTKNLNGNEEEDDDDDEEEEEEEEEEEKEGVVDVDFAKKRGSSNSSNISNSGSGVMEGSRCSRVNGRGWRCCQQTLVGYALCEHHLGKGRLRSMTSVRSRSSAIVSARNDVNNIEDDDNDVSLLSLSYKRRDAVDEEEEEEEELMITKDKNKKKRKRIGTVKARSISSLLGQTQQVASVTPAPIAIALGNNQQQQQHCGMN